MLLLTPTCLVQSRTFSTDFASIMRRIHLDLNGLVGFPVLAEKSLRCSLSLSVQLVFGKNAVLPDLQRAP